MRFYAYLRASTKEQNASRAESELREFSEQHHFKISAFSERMNRCSIAQA